MQGKILTILAILTAFVFMTSYLITYSQDSNLTGQAYYSTHACVYCAEHCGGTHPNSGGAILSSNNIKALEPGCKGEFHWISSNLDVNLCCR